MGSIDVMTAVLANGLTVPYAETGTSVGEPVVFVPALHGYAPRQRGNGDADQPTHGYLPEDFAADIVGFMDVLGISGAALVGSSSGGLVSQLVASTYPDRVSALILISSPAYLGDKPAVAAMWEEVSALEDPLGLRARIAGAFRPAARPARTPGPGHYYRPHWLGGGKPAD